MSTTANRSAPTLGVAIGYFAITLWAVPDGLITAEHATEAVAMAGVVVTNLLMEIKGFFRWVGSFYRKAPEPEK